MSNGLQRELKQNRPFVTVQQEAAVALMRTADLMRRSLTTVVEPHGITLQQFNEPAGGQVVFHLHFHILPRLDGVSLGPPANKMEKPDVLAANAERIKKALAA